MDWARILGPSGSFEEFRRNLSVRGRNLLFLQDVADALQLDNVAPSNWDEVKRAVTPDAVRKIHLSVLHWWPADTDLKALAGGVPGQLSSLYVGSYSTRRVLSAVSRQSIYCDRMLFIDPMLYATSVRPEFSPLENPEQFVVDTIKHLGIWFATAPWIDAGLVGFIRSTADFNPTLNWASMEAQRAKFDANPELAAELERTVGELIESSDGQDMQRFLALCQSPERLLGELREAHPNWSTDDVDIARGTFERMRAQHPYYKETLGADGRPLSQLIRESSGENYHVARLTAEASESYLVTDLPSRWKEIELDRGLLGVSDGMWTPFAKAFQSLPFRYLDSVDVALALEVRDKDRLRSLRSFLSRSWQTVAKGAEFEDRTALFLAAELDQRVNEAEAEWRKVDIDVMKWAGGALSMGSIPAVLSGNAAWAAGAAVAAGITLAAASWQRAVLPKRYPAALFMKLQKKES